ncbi:MAG: cytochrome c peroxidase [bacterium]|nr:cytochrome c peroxidase [bacterium]
MKLVHSFAFLFLTPVLFSCLQVDPKIEMPLPADHLIQTIPEGWPQPVYQFENNPITENRFILGRYLFYERLLSSNNTISCGSCHQNFTAFANADHAVSHGINNLTGKRNSPSIFNVAWHPAFMHDGGINHIEVQPLAPIQNPVEMGEKITHVVEKLQASEKYRNLFTLAYGDDSVTTQRMFWSMAQFMGLMLSSESKYDRFKRHEEELTAQELRGYNQFVEKCSSCHKEPLMSDFKYRNNGVAISPIYQDSGRYRITKQPGDLYKFKTPSLRNIALTKPYMHDGRYATLEQCLDHYTNGIKNLTNLDPSLTTGIPLSPEQKKDIIVFLNTLTDFNFIADKRFSDPNYN